MVTGAYHPELSGGGLQCQAIVDALGSEIAFAVLATCTDPSCSGVQWGSGSSQNVVWGQRCGGMNCSSGGSNQGGVSSTTVVWGSSGNDTVVWGSTSFQERAW